MNFAIIPIRSRSHS